MSIDQTDAAVLTTHLSDLRGEVRIYHALHKRTPGTYNGDIATGLMVQANALGRALAALGVSGLPPSLTLDQE